MSVMVAKKTDDLADWIVANGQRLGGFAAAHLRWPEIIRTEIATILDSNDAGKTAVSSTAFIRRAREKYATKITVHQLRTYLETQGRKSWTRVS
jgi:hypothetical protein